MSAETQSADINRRLESLVRLGTIAAVDHGAALCRVKTGGLVTEWLPWLERRAGTTRDWDPPTAGEQCLLLSPSGDPASGIVLVGIFSNAAPAPNNSPDECTREYPDGARITYNHASGHLSVTGIKTFLVEASDNGVVDCPDVTFTGNVLIQGTCTIKDLLTYQNGLRGQGGSGGNGNSITGTFAHRDGELSSNGVVLHTHDHTISVGQPIASSPWPEGWE